MNDIKYRRNILWGARRILCMAHNLPQPDRTSSGLAAGSGLRRTARRTIHPQALANVTAIDHLNLTAVEFVAKILTGYLLQTLTHCKGQTLSVGELWMRNLPL